MRKLKPVALLATIATVTLAVVGCGGNGGATTATEGSRASSDNSTGAVTLNVGVIPIVDVAPLYLGMKKGFFEAEHLTIKPHAAQGGAAIVPGVVSGELQIGFSNTVSEIIARSKGLPIKIIASAQKVPEPSVDYSAVVVEQGSAIRTPNDLEGKTVAVNTLKNVGGLTIRAALEKDGVDASKVKFVEVPFPDMQSALDSGQVDAIWVVQQFLTAAKAAGGRPIVDNFAAVGKFAEGAAYFTTETYISQHPDIVARFTRAMNRSLRYADAHPAEVRKTILTYTEVPRDAVAHLELARWTPKLNTVSLQRLIDLAAKYDFVTDEPSLRDLAHTP